MMKTLTLLALIAWVAIAADDPKTLATKLKQAEQETRLAKLEGLVLREQIATQQLEKIRGDQQALYAETCKAAEIDPDPKVCMIDLNAKTVTKKTVDPPKK